MRRRSNVFGSVVAAICLVAAVTAASPFAQQASSAPQTPTFRAGATVIPVDVRVLDKHGVPVTDLKREDFTILEDGKPQAISNFVAEHLTAQPITPDAAPDRTKHVDLAPQPGRVLLLVLGRGRLQGPSKGADAMIRLVGERLLPQDQVAVMAFNRASDFSTDHAKIVSVLERFRDQHEKIDEEINNYWLTMPGDEAGEFVRMRGTGFPAWIQQEIDGVFGETLAVRELPPTPESTMSRQTRDATDLQQGITRAAQAADRTAMAAGTGIAPPKTLSAATDDRALEFFDLPNQQLSALDIFTTQELARLYTAITYLRPIAGEKHLVFVTEDGLYLPAVEGDRSLAALANDSRVAIDTIQVGGLPTLPPPGFAGETAIAGPVRPRSPARPNTSAVTQSFSTPWVDQVMVKSIQAMSNLTGGQSSIYDYADTATAKIVASTASGYLLGYTTPNARWDGGYRRIEVRVNRRDVTLLYRHGYYAHEDVGPTDYRRVVTYSRVTLAANNPQEMHGIKLTVLDATPGRAEGKSIVTVRVRVDIGTVAFAADSGLKAATLDLAFFCGDQDNDNVGESWQQIALKLNDEDLGRMRTEQLTYATKIIVKGQPQRVRAIVYDFASDRVGSASAPIK